MRILSCMCEVHHSKDTKFICLQGDLNPDIPLESQTLSITEAENEGDIHLEMENTDSGLNFV